MAAVFGLLIASGCARAEVETGVDAEAGLPFWELREPGMSLRLVQRQPDQTRAFFMARGFPKDAAERVAVRCVFQTVFKNLDTGTNGSPLEYDLRDWIVRGEGSNAVILTRERWEATWEKLQVPKPARIAFAWGLYPTQQVYNPGDYNWGMTVFDLAPGDRFDLTVVWRQGGGPRRARIEGLQCAPDSASPPVPPSEQSSPASGGTR